MDQHSAWTAQLACAEQLRCCPVSRLLSAREITCSDLRIGRNVVSAGSSSSGQKSGACWTMAMNRSVDLQPACVSTERGASPSLFLSVSAQPDMRSRMHHWMFSCHELEFERHVHACATAAASMELAPKPWPRTSTRVYL